jgi:hypothetical protein
VTGSVNTDHSDGTETWRIVWMGPKSAGDVGPCRL